jgi:hypothetical protein
MQRPVSLSWKRWTDAEIEEVKRGLLLGYHPSLIAYQIGRSCGATAEKIFALFQTRDLDKIRNTLKEGKSA